MKKTRTRLKNENELSPIDGWLTDPISVQSLSATAEPEYVAWIDLMGARAWMAGSIRKAAEIIGVIHIAGIRAAHDHKVKAYPVIDGIYLVGKGKSDFRAATRSVMHVLAATFVARPDADRFLVRGGIAYGRVLHGLDVAKLHHDLEKKPSYSNCLAIGVSIGQAYQAEGKAPPFGYYVDMTARSTASIDHVPYTSSFFRWWSTSSESMQAKAFGSLLDAHFQYLRRNHRELEYSLDRLDEHRLLAGEYFRIEETIAKIPAKDAGIGSRLKEPLARR